MRNSHVTDPNGTTAEVLEHSAGSWRLALPDGRTVLMDERLVREEGDTLVSTRSFEEITEASGTVIPRVEETLRIDKVLTDRATVRLHKTVEERRETVDLPLMSEEVEVERVPMQELIVVSEPPPVRYEGETMIVPLVEETIVVERRLVLREEVRVTKRKQTIHHPQEYVLRSEHLDSERIEHATSPIAPAGE